jgi:hypothetical protein
MEAEIAWALAETTSRHLDANQRNTVYVAIAAGDHFWAVRFLLRAVVHFELAVPADLIPKLLKLDRAYRDHPDERSLRQLIGRLIIQPADRPQDVRPAQFFLPTVRRYTSIRHG